MGTRHVEQLLSRFRKGDVKNPFTPAHAFEKKLQGQCRLARAGIALDKKNPATR